MKIGAIEDMMIHYGWKMLKRNIREWREEKQMAQAERNQPYEQIGRETSAESGDRS